MFLAVTFSEILGARRIMFQQGPRPGSEADIFRLLLPALVDRQRQAIRRCHAAIVDDAGRDADPALLMASRMPLRIVATIDGNRLGAIAIAGKACTGIRARITVERTTGNGTEIESKRTFTNDGRFRRARRCQTLGPASWLTSIE